MQQMNRRFFLRNGALAVAGTTAIPSFLVRSVMAQTLTAPNRRLVVIFQRGAADGLNIVVPYREKNYYSMRPSIAIPQELSRPTQAVEQSPAAIGGAFLRANPRLPPDSVVVTCSAQDVPRLREVHVCLDRELAPRSCAADALRAACRAPQVIVPPIR